MGWNEGNDAVLATGYVQVVVVLHGEKEIALQQSDVVVVDLRRPPVLLQ